MAQRRPDRTLGPGHNEFWRYCGQRELRLQRCADCGQMAWPVVKACESCGSAQLSWERVAGHGRVVSWCSFERDYYHGLLPMPWDTILVELDEGPLFISNPQGFGWREITPNMRVRLAFITCEDSAGVFSLPVFERASASLRVSGDARAGSR